MSNMFPHLMPDRYRELMRAARIWQLLKLMEWKGSPLGRQSHSATHLPTAHQIRWPRRLGFVLSRLSSAGCVDSKIIETLWSILNIISPSAQGMSFPHRQELLDYQMNSSNFQKMIRMAGSLKRKLRAAMVGAEDSLAAFRALDDGIPDDQRNSWLKQEMAVMCDCSIDPKAMNVFNVRMAKASLSTLCEDHRDLSVGTGACC
ncbi:hypothetical protein PAXRUDRAFT_20688 [Paxillus rubicundulus Ve08.2h10]|uniref:Unplaced genomic scaffold scaffold_4771, whole genome shotgun sequence n=1 Tax=Paxillus rubicundulus Ve08.2h10 TaxID=930991 RepID=A0A0D0D174_9AGAM|nr:hypothetical protein PAXRUDRAFT_20688 [Paxillus rubicundulus Ve08.2h10]